MKPSDLNGKKFGVRSYTQTTGIWVRGILAESYGVDWSKVEITTMEDPHVAQYKDPSFVKRAPETKQLPQMLIDGELDAALIGDKFPDPRFKTLVPDAEAANKKWAETHGGVPINHMVIVRETDRQGAARRGRGAFPGVQGGARPRHDRAEGQAGPLSVRRRGQPRGAGAGHRLFAEAADDHRRRSRSTSCSTTSRASSARDDARAARSLRSSPSRSSRRRSAQDAQISPTGP